jgi:hypothetical protein
MDGWKILEKSPPMTRRQNVWHYSFCASCVALTAAIIGYNVLAYSSIEAQLIPGDMVAVKKGPIWTNLETINLPNFALRGVSVALGNCHPDHFWGHLVYYREDDTVQPREHFVHVGRACRDWSNSRWILVRDVPFGWSRYWR